MNNLVKRSSLIIFVPPNPATVRASRPKLHWLVWVALVLTMAAALLFAPLVKTYYYKSDQTFRRSLASVLVDWADEHIYLDDWTDWQ